MSPQAAKLLAAVIGSTLLIALYGKLDSWREWRTAAASWTPAHVSPRLPRIGVPLAELVVALMLIIRPTLGLLAAGVLFWVLGVGVFAISPRHQGEECSCFGDFASSRIGPRLGLRDVLIGTGCLVAWVLSVSTEVDVVGPEFLLSAILVAVAFLTLRQLLRMTDAADALREESWTL